MTENFSRFTVESRSTSYIPFPRFLMEDTLANLSNDAKVLYALMLDRASISKVNGFIESDGTIRLYFYCRTSAEEAASKSAVCHTHIPRVGVKRSDLLQETGAWKACADHAQLSVQCKTDPAEGDRRDSVWIMVENRIFFAPQATQTLRGISLLIRAIKTHLCAVKGGTE